MTTFSASMVRRVVPWLTFVRLRTLLQEIGDYSRGAAANTTTDTLTEAVLSTVSVPPELQNLCFFALVSPSFSALLCSTPLYPADFSQREPADYQITLTFDPGAIAHFLAELIPLFIDDADAQETLQRLTQVPQPNNPTVQSEFTLRLVEVLSAKAPPLDPTYPVISVCQPMEAALQQQVEQERLLNQVSSQIRQSLDLATVLETAVQQVQNFLQVDRLVIFQFERTGDQQRGLIAYESRINQTIASVMYWNEQERCFIEESDCWHKYRQGFTLAVSDVEAVYVLSPCLLKLMRQMQVRAKLVVPIVVQEELWGLLVAHQCFEPRLWEAKETTFLQNIAQHLAIAIYQSQLYTQVQQQKQTLEERVIGRTQELHDAMLAAQAANRAKSEFLATMSHELKTPLTCVIGMSSTLLRWSFGNLNSRQQHYLKIIHDSGEHLLALINDILDLSQVEAGKVFLNISQFSLSRLAQQSLQTLQEKANHHGIEIKLELRLEPYQDEFPADRRRVKQILLNLLSNAIKFTPEGGQVILRVWLEGTMTVLQVEDTGIGIADYQRSLLFQKFQQLDPAYDRKYEGTGLGLALTKQLVELHGGWIEVESVVGVGSSFTVRLPAQSLEPIEEAVVAPLEPQHSLGRIVLISDQEETAMLICDLLTAANYQVIWMVDGSMAIHQIKLLQPLAVITGMQLPGMGGNEVIRHLHASTETQTIKILALLPVPEGEEQAVDVQTEADDYLVEPIQPEQLLDKVKALLDSSSHPKLSG